jgi:hypothetical protein
MEFEPEDYFTYNEIKNLITNPIAFEKGDLIANHIKKYMVLNNGDLYKLDKSNITYKQVDNKQLENNILALSAGLVGKSFNRLTDEQKELITDKYPKKYEFIFQNVTFKNLLPQIYEGITVNIIFDDYVNQLHFRNGFINLKDGTLHNRVIGQHYITKFVNRDYIPSSKRAQDDLEIMLNKIYPDNEDKDAVMFKLLTAFTGLTNLDKELLFLLGMADSAKSTIMKILQMALPCYILALKNDTFTLGNQTINKVLSTFDRERQILIAWVNEMDDKRIDKNLFKKFCEGEIEFTKLYQNCLYNLQLKCKSIFTSNDMPNFGQIDTGVVTRVTAYTQQSKFTKYKNEVDESKHIYLGDKLLLQKKENDNDFKNAVVDIVIKYCIKYNNNEVCKLTANFNSTKSEIMLCNDKYQDFIDARLEITDDVNNRIGKEMMMKQYSEQFKNSHVSFQQLLTHLKAKNIKYEPQLRSDGVQGCFVGVKLKRVREYETIEEENEINAIIEEREYYKNKCTSQEEEILALKEMIKKLEGKTNEEKPKVIVNVIENTKPIFYEANEEDDEAVEEIMKSISKKKTLVAKKPVAKKTLVKKVIEKREMKEFISDLEYGLPKDEPTVNVLDIVGAELGSF